jgi:hypothetical protein
VYRQRTIWTKQAEEPHLQSWRRAILTELERRQWRWREGQIGILTKPNGLVDRTQRCTPTRFLIVQALDPAQRLVEVEAVRFPRDLLQER